MQINLKKILPIESYDLTSKLGEDEVRKRISENIEQKKTFRFSLFKNNSTKPYEGEISNDTFKINRIINYRNSFLPVITGHISKSYGQTIIKIKMRMIVAVIIFMSLWLSIVGLVCAILLLGVIFKLKHVIYMGFSFGTLIPFIMFLFGWSLMFFGFKYESKKTWQFLSSLLEGQEANNNGIYISSDRKT